MANKRLPLKEQLQVLYNTPKDLRGLNDLCIKMTGKTLGYGGIVYIQDSGEKKKDSIYLDKFKPGLYYCKANSTTTSNDTSIFIDYSNYTIGDKLENLFFYNNFKVAYFQNFVGMHWVKLTFDHQERYSGEIMIKTTGGEHTPVCQKIFTNIGWGDIEERAFWVKNIVEFPQYSCTKVGIHRYDISKYSLYLYLDLRVNSSPYIAFYDYTNGYRDFTLSRENPPSNAKIFNLQ